MGAYNVHYIQPDIDEAVNEPHTERRDTLAAAADAVRIALENIDLRIERNEGIVPLDVTLSMRTNARFNGEPFIVNTTETD